VVWRVAAAELDAYRRAYGLDHAPPAKHVWGRVARDGLQAAPATTPTADRADATGEQRERRRRGERRPAVAADQWHRTDPDRLLGAQPRRDRPGRRRDWQAARTALEHLTGWSRHRDHRDQPHPNLERPGRTAGRNLGHQERDGR